MVYLLLIKIVTPLANVPDKPSSRPHDIPTCHLKSKWRHFHQKITPETPLINKRRKTTPPKRESHCLLINSQLTDFFFLFLFFYFLLKKERKKESWNGALIRTSPLVDGKHENGSNCGSSQIRG